MSVNQISSWFQFQDLLVRMVPGASIIGVLMVISFDKPITWLSELSLGFTLSLVILAYIIGEVIDMGALFFMYTPPEFALSIREVHDDPESVVLGPVTSFIEYAVTNWVPDRIIGDFEDRSMIFTKTKEDFWELFKERYQVDKELTDPRDIYRILLLDIEPAMTRSTLRYYTLTNFSRNMMFTSLFITAVLLGMLILGQLSGEFLLRAVLILLFSVILSVIFLALRSNFETEFIHRLFTEFYLLNISKRASEGS